MRSANVMSIYLVPLALYPSSESKSDFSKKLLSRERAMKATPMGFAFTSKQKKKAPRSCRGPSLALSRAKIKLSTLAQDDTTSWCEN